MNSPLAPGGEILRVSNLHSFYGESHILHGVDFSVKNGELVTLLGRNGAGRTTTLKSILGLVGKRTGSIVLNGQETIQMPTHRIAHLGVAYCPEERGIFASLSCEENLLLPPEVQSGGMGVDEIYEMFPNTEGLAPVIVQTLGRVLRKLKDTGYTIVLVEQNFRFAAPIADRHYVLEHGLIVMQVRKDELESKTEEMHEYLGV
jgi:branched-chain amino acid transport system ATP-binding protein